MAHPQHNFTSNFNGSDGHNAELTLNINGVEKKYTPAGNDQTYNVPGVARIDINLDGADLVQAIQTALDGAAQPMLAEMSIYDEEYIYQYIGDIDGQWYFGACTTTKIVTIAVDKEDGAVNSEQIPITNGVVIVPSDSLSLYAQLRTALGLGQLPVLNYVGANPVYAQYEKTADNGDLIFVGAFVTQSTPGRIGCTVYTISADNTIVTTLRASPDNSSLVHKTDAETITGIKTFSNDISPRQTSPSFSKQSKVFVCSVIKPYAEWSAEEKDNNHFRLWSIDITSVVSAASTHGNIVVKLMGSFYSTAGNGALQKEITFQVYNGNIVISKGDYTVAQSPCADEFVISGIIKSGDNYLLQVINRDPASNNYPLRLEIGMFNKSNSAVLDDVTMTESITEGLPGWAVDVAQVTANESPVLTEATAATVAKTGDYNDLSHKPSVPEMFRKAFTVNPLAQQELTAADITNGYVDIELSLGATIDTGLGYTIWIIGLPNSNYSGWKLAQMYDRIEVYTHGENLQLLAVRYDDLTTDDYGNTLSGADIDHTWNRTFTGNGLRVQAIDAFVVRCYLKSSFGWAAGTKAPIKIWFTSIS